MWLKFGGKVTEDYHRFRNPNAWLTWRYDGPGGGPTGSFAQLAFPGNPWQLRNGAGITSISGGTPTFPNRTEIARLFREKPEYFTSLATVANFFTAFIDNPSYIRERLLAGYAKWSTTEKAEAILTLATRPESARRLLRELRANRIPKSDVSAFAARQLQRVIGPNFTEFWGPLEIAAADKEAETARLKRLLTDEALAAARPGHGRGVFERTCAPCHRLYDQGGLIGPDLTGSNRANLDYILGEIINPSEVIQEGYQLVTLTLRDGRTLAGNIAAENDRQVTLRTIGQETPVAKADILSREVSPVSMMPEGLLKTLTGDEVRDLIAYLRTTRQVTAEQ